MTHVRLPVVAEFVLPKFSGPATIESAMDDVDQALERLLGLGYAVSVDMHPGSDFVALQRRDPAAAHAALIDGWPQVAARLKRWPAERIFAELLNEPATTGAIWRPFVEELARAVRAQLPNSYLIVGSAPYERVDEITSWTPLADRKIVYACHYYDPMLFTHQGSSWDKSSPWGRVAGVPFPTSAGDPALMRLAQNAEGGGDAALAGELRKMADRAWDGATMSAQFGALGQWSAQHSVPVVINEFGVLKWKAKRADRLAWLAAARAAIEAQGFGWAHWDYAASFGLLDDSGAIDDGVIRALIPS